MSKHSVQIWDHEKHLQRAVKKWGNDFRPEMTLPQRRALYKIGDKVITPRGRGRVGLVEDGLVCVEFDHDPEALYEFEPHKLQFAKKGKRKKHNRS